jgi:hypothetical protein
VPFQIEPFRILHNFRGKDHQHDRPKRKVSACERFNVNAEYTIRTRKMTAEIEQMQYVRIESNM